MTMKEGEYMVVHPGHNGKGLWRHWCDVDGYSLSDCACSVGWYWFSGWGEAERADANRRQRGQQ